MEDKEIIEGYAAESSVWVGNKRFIFGISEDKNESIRYMTCAAEPGAFGTYYENAVTDSDYFEAMKRYVADIQAEIAELERARAEIGIENVECLTASELTPADRSVRIADRVVAIDERAICPAYRDIAHQLYYVNSGFGVEANSRGNACYGWNLYSGEKTRIERYDVIGIVPEEKLPDFARAKLADIRARGKARDKKSENEREER